MGFHRTSQRRTLSQDNNTLTTVVVDTQQAGAVLPNGLISGSFEHSWASTPGSRLLTWNGTFQATYEVASRGGNVGEAVADFRQLVDDRISLARGMRKADKDLKPGPDRVGASLIPMQFTATDANVYGRQMEKFSMSYLLPGVFIDELLRAGGLWRPWHGEGREDRTWKAWQASVETAQSPRGIAELVMTIHDNKIVDLCRAEKLFPQLPGRDPPAPPRDNVIPEAARGIIGGVDAWAKMFPPPKPEESWLRLQTAVTIASETGCVVGGTLPTVPFAVPSSQVPMPWDALKSDPPGRVASGLPFPDLRGSMSGQSNAGSETFVQQRTRPKLYVTLTGHALRCNHEVVCPAIALINGVKATLVGTPQFTQCIVAHAVYPIHFGSWSLTYVAEGNVIADTAIPSPKNTNLG